MSRVSHLFRVPDGMGLSECPYSSRNMDRSVSLVSRSQKNVWGWHNKGVIYRSIPSLTGRPPSKAQLPRAIFLRFPPVSRSLFSQFNKSSLCPMRPNFSKNTFCPKRRSIVTLISPGFDPWAPSVDSQSLASSFFALSLLPYLGFLYHLSKSKTAPGLTLFGFYFLLAFVGATSKRATWHTDSRVGVSNQPWRPTFTSLSV